MSQFIGCNTNDWFFTLGVACVRESVGTQVVRESHLMHIMNIQYKIISFMWNMIGCLCMSLHVHFRWGVAL